MRFDHLDSKKQKLLRSLTKPNSYAGKNDYMNNNDTTIKYICPMHPEIISNKPGVCPKCDMRFVKAETKTKHGVHSGHTMGNVSKMGFWEKFKMSMSMTMGMDHTGLAGREMARLMEIDIRNKFFFSLILTVPIILYSPLSTEK